MCRYMIPHYPIQWFKCLYTSSSTNTTNNIDMHGVYRLSGVYRILLYIMMNVT